MSAVLAFAAVAFFDVSALATATCWWWAQARGQAMSRFGRGALVWMLASGLIVGQLAINGHGLPMILLGTLALWGGVVPLLVRAWRAFAADWPTGSRAVRR